MARPRRSEHNRDMLLEQGIELLSTQGYHGTGLKQILDAVKVPKGSFYNYFESKEAFVAAIIRRYADNLLGRFERSVATSADGPMATIKRAYAELISDHEQSDHRQGCLIGDMAAELGHDSPAIQAALAEALTRWKGCFAPLMEKAQQSGEVRRDIDAEVLVDVFLNAWEGSLLRMKIENDTTALRRNFDLMMDVLFAPC
jgi:TetR/AcrR family transcriptional repressor of nem operon